MKFTLLLATTAVVGALAAPAFAQDAPPPEDEDAPEEAQDHVHEDLGQEIIVTAAGIRNLNLLAGTATLSGSELVREMRPQLGETLTRLPGVSATSFGPGASRPVLRGFAGDEWKENGPKAALLPPASSYLRSACTVLPSPSMVISTRT